MYAGRCHSTSELPFGCRRPLIHHLYSAVVVVVVGCSSSISWPHVCNASALSVSRAPQMNPAREMDPALVRQGYAQSYYYSPGALPRNMSQTGERLRLCRGQLGNVGCRTDNWKWYIPKLEALGDNLTPNLKVWSPQSGSLNMSIWNEVVEWGLHLYRGLPNDENI